MGTERDDRRSVGLDANPAASARARYRWDGTALSRQAQWPESARWVSRSAVYPAAMARKGRPKPPEMQQALDTVGGIPRTGNAAAGITGARGAMAHDPGGVRGRHRGKDRS